MTKLHAVRKFPRNFGKIMFQTNLKKSVREAFSGGGPGPNLQPLPLVRLFYTMQVLQYKDTDILKYTTKDH